MQEMLVRSEKEVVIVSLPTSHKIIWKNLDHFESIDLNARYQIGTTAFIMACVNGDKNVVKFLLDMIKAKCRSERIEPNARDNDGWTAFMIACRYGHKDVVKLLLDMIKAKFG